MSAFGLTGSLAHVVVSGEHAGEHEPVVHVDAGARRPLVLPLSAASPEALSELLLRHAERIERVPESAGELCRDAAYRRSALSERLVVVADGAEELAQRLRIEAESIRDVPPARSRARSELEEPAEPRGPVFVYPGQGAQWLGMGRELLASEPAFRRLVEECERVVRDENGWSVLEEIHASPAGSRLDEVQVFHPVLCAVMMGLTELWRRVGIEPAAVVGTSMGEIPAAWASGALDLESAMRLCCRRANLVVQSEPGIMAALALSLEEAREAIADVSDRVAVAVHNGPLSHVIAGDPDLVRRVVDEQRQRGVRASLVRGAYFASHSPHMDPVTPRLAQAAADLTPRPTRIDWVSTASGELVDGTQAGAAYWVQNLRCPVLLPRAIETLLARGHRRFLEVSPHPVLTSALRDTLNAASEGPRSTRVQGTLVRDAPEVESFWCAFGELWAEGGEVDWGALHPTRGHYGGGLPTYPWQRRRHWIDAPDPGAQSVDLAQEQTEESTGGDAASLLEVGPVEQEPERLRALGELLERSAARVLGLERVDPLRPLTDQGLTSLMDAELRTVLERTFGRTWPSTLLHEHPTLEGLAPSLSTGGKPLGAPEARATEPPAGRTEPRVTTTLPLLPAQASSLNLDVPMRRDTPPFPLYRLMAIDRRLDRGEVESLVSASILRHEALRTRLVRTSLGWAQQLLDPRDVPLSLESLDLGPTRDPDAAASTIEEAVRAAREELGIAQERYAAYRILELGQGRNALLVVLDHMIADFTSERLFAADLLQGLGMLRRGQAPSYPRAAGRLVPWLEELAARVQSGAHDGDAELWREEALREVVRLPVKASPGAGAHRTSTCAFRLLDPTTSAWLAERSASRLGATLPEVLLGIVASELTAWAGGPLAINVIASGRHSPAAPSHEVGSSLGFFSIGHPAVFSPSPPGEGIVAVRDAQEVMARTTRRVDLHAFRWYRPMPAVLGTFDAFQGKVEVFFNYRGKVDSFLRAPLQGSDLTSFLEEAAVSESPVSRLVQEDPNPFGRVKLNVVTGNLGGRVGLWFAHRKAELDTSTVEGLLDRVCEGLQALTTASAGG